VSWIVDVMNHFVEVIGGSLAAPDTTHSAVGFNADWYSTAHADAATAGSTGSDVGSLVQGLPILIGALVSIMVFSLLGLALVVATFGVFVIGPHLLGGAIGWYGPDVVRAWRERRTERASGRG
jgi:hypothetical protein